ncbi:tripartite tricarboxylate transporter TctB family protein [Paracoccus sp. (in: a-proteobacteria)]|uniref:tripartite tricarboxylate transporter TctB family protein n=1 Tax=Paracoccus sp. TaxID=267 RepID=UPI0035B49AFC
MSQARNTAGRSVLKETNVLAGILFMALGGAAFLLTRHLSLGNALMIGSGFMPQAVSVLLVLFGAGIAIAGLRHPSDPVEIGSLRPLLTVTVCIAVFAFTLERLGLVAAILLVVALSPLAGSRPRPLRLAAVGVALAALCTAIFVWGAKLPIAAGPF